MVYLPTPSPLLAPGGCLHILYIGKILLEQNFVELPTSPSEENFIIKNFVPVLHSSKSIHENHEILYHMKISCYNMVLYRYLSRILRQNWTVLVD